MGYVISRSGRGKTFWHANEMARRRFSRTARSLTGGDYSEAFLLLAFNSFQFSVDTFAYHVSSAPFATFKFSMNAWVKYPVIDTLRGEPALGRER